MKFSNFYLSALFILVSISGFGQSNSSNNKVSNDHDYKLSIFTTWLSFSNFGKPATNT